MEIRTARGGDRAAIVAFLRREDPDDYVIEWMDRFVRGGRFFLLLEGRRIAGVVHGQRAPDGSAWMSAARIAEKYRGHGWINRMNDYALASPALKGARSARMLITADNKSSLRAAQKGGYRVAARLSFMDWDPPKRSGAPRRPSGYARVSVRQFARDAAPSRVISAQNGLAYESFTGAYALTPDALRRTRRWLFASRSAGPLIAAMFPDTGERWMAAQPLRISGAVASALIAFAAERRADSLTAILPDGDRFRRPFHRAGFKQSAWAKHVNIFEKPLAMGPRAMPSRGRRRAER